jgi:hypothetical protein
MGTCNTLVLYVITAPAENQNSGHVRPTSSQPLWLCMQETQAMMISTNTAGSCNSASRSPICAAGCD